MGPGSKVKDVGVNIHHFFYVMGQPDSLDEFGDARRGHYYEFVLDSIPTRMLCGPYGSALDAEAAGCDAYDKGDY